MVTEVVEIVVRERGAARTKSSLSSLGSAAKTAALAVTALGAALAGVAAFQLGGLVRDSIRVSAEFEQLNVRLAALLGSQEEANTALENFTRLAATTPFSVQQIVGGAATLAAAALGNRESLEALTQTAANLAAVTGLSFQDAAGNLQRALAGGIGAADLFRERGVRALIESINGIPDATKLSLQELDQAFQDTFGANGTFGTAAADLSRTLGGSISNIGDAFINLQDAIGDAFAPAVIGAAQQAIIPFLTRLEELVRNNQDEIQAFALGALSTLAGTFASVIRGVSNFLTFLARARLGVLQLAQGLLQLQIAANTVGGTIAEAFGGDSDDNITAIEELRLAQRLLAEDITASAATIQSFGDGAEAVAAQVDQLGAAIGGVGGVDVAAPADLGGAGGTDPAEIEAAAKAAEAAEKARLAATEALVQVNERLAAQDAARLGSFQAQLFALNRQLQEIAELERISGDSAAADQARLGVQRELANVLREQADAVGDLQAAETNLAALLTELSALSASAAGEIQSRLQEAIANGAVGAELLRIIEGLTDDAEAAIADRRVDLAALAESFREDFSASLASGIRDAITGGEQLDVAEIFAQNLADKAEEALSKSLNTLFEDLASSFAEQLSDSTKDALGGLGGGGGGLGSLLGGALAIGGLFAASAIAGDDAQVTRSSVGSAVNQSTPVRGVVAGPTNIPIFQVGAEIESAFEGTNTILQQLVSLTSEELDVLRAIASNGTGGSVDTQAATLITTTPPSAG